MKKFLSITTVLIIVISSCSKTSEVQTRSQLDKQSSKLIIDWTNVHFRLIKNTTGVSHPAFSRHFGYTGVALYESLVYGDNKKRSIATSLNGSIKLPQPPSANHIFFPASANAAFAAMFRFFYAGKEANFLVIDSLETAYKNKYATEITPNFDIAQSIEYGKGVAAAVIELSKTDGAANASTPYTVLGEGYWEPTPPAFGPAAIPGWGNNRTILTGSINNSMPTAPISFSKETTSPFYAMVKEVYDVSQSLTNEQKALATFWDDAPNGKYITAFGHWFNILKQIIEKENTPLMEAADAYLRLGVTMNDLTISTWKAKYTFNYLRPVTYIRKYMAHTTWNSFLGTPAHPEYTSAHASISSSAAYALESIFGKNYSFTDNTYSELGMTPRNYSSLEAAGIEAGISRLYAGIHFRPSITAGKTQGDKVGENVKNILKTNK